MTDRKIALVTGAGSGIGRAVSFALLGAGWKVVLVGRRNPQLEETIALAPSGQDNAIAMPCDVSKPDAVEELFADLENRSGRLDLLFNNAGMGSPTALIDEIPVDTWMQVLGVNLTGSFLCARAAFGLMRRQKPQGGRIINNGSISAHRPRPGSAPYTTTKHAISGLTKSLALDGRPFNIACGQIDIGNAASEMTESMLTGMPQADGRVAAEPVMDVDHVAAAVLSMAQLPLEANVLSMTIMANAMPFVGRG